MAYQLDEWELPNNGILHESYRCFSGVLRLRCRALHFGFALSAATTLHVPTPQPKKKQKLMHQRIAHALTDTLFDSERG